MPRRTLIDPQDAAADAQGMERAEAPPPEPTPACIVCGRDAVTIDRDDVPMCGRHAAIFVTMDHRDKANDRARIVR